MARKRAWAGSAGYGFRGTLGVFTKPDALFPQCMAALAIAANSSAHRLLLGFSAAWLTFGIANQHGGR